MQLQCVLWQESSKSPSSRIMCITARHAGSPCGRAGSHSLECRSTSRSMRPGRVAAERSGVKQPGAAALSALQHPAAPDGEQVLHLQLVM